MSGADNRMALTASFVGACADPRIRLHFHSRNQGLVSSLTTGLALVTGSLVARMDADDISHPERLALQVAYMDQHSDVEVLGTAVEVFRSEGFTGAPSAAAAATEAPATAATAAAAGDEKPLLTRTASHVLYTEARSTVERASHTLRNDAGSEPAPPLAQSRAHRLDAATASTEAWTARSLARPASSRVITHPSGPALVSWTLNFFCPLAHPSVMVRSATLRGLSGGAYQPGWVDVEDLELWQRASRAGVKMDNLSRVLLRLRKHGGNVSSADASAEASSPSNAASLSASAVPASPSSPSSASASSSSAAAAAASPSHAALSRSAPLQKLHAVLATSVHMSLVTRAAVSADFAYALMHPCAATLPSVDHVATALRLLLALERAALHPPQAGGIGTVSRGEFEAIKLDATSRMGELVTLAMMSGGGGGKTGSSVPSSPSNSSQAASSSSPPPATAAASSMAPAAAASPASPRAASSSSSLPSASAAPAPLSALAALQLSALGSSRAEAASSTCFSLPTPGSSATALWRQWMGRGADSATLLAKLLGKS